MYRLEFKNALNQTKMYSDTTHMSKAILFDHLTSEFGGQFPDDSAQYDTENVVADWKENALKKAINYQEIMSTSKEPISDQIASEFSSKKGGWASLNSINP